MQAACERMDRMREENRRLFGEQNITVELIREAHDHLMEYVLDSSVALKWVLSEADSGKAIPLGDPP